MKSMKVFADASVVQLAVEFVILHVLMVVRALFLIVFFLFRLHSDFDFGKLNNINGMI